MSACATILLVLGALAGRVSWLRRRPAGRIRALIEHARDGTWRPGSMASWRSGAAVPSLAAAANGRARRGCRLRGAAASGRPRRSTRCTSRERRGTSPSAAAPWERSDVSRRSRSVQVLAEAVRIDPDAGRGRPPRGRWDASDRRPPFSPLLSGAQRRVQWVRVEAVAALAGSARPRRGRAGRGPGRRQLGGAAARARALATMGSAGARAARARRSPARTPTAAGGPHDARPIADDQALKIWRGSGTTRTGASGTEVAAAEQRRRQGR